MAKADKLQKTNAMRELERAGIAYAVHVYDDDGSTESGLGVAVARKLGQDPDRGFKTLVTETPDGRHVVCCIPVAEELDLKLAARAAGEKALSMLHMKDLLAVTGYVRGACTPIGMKKRYPVLVDETCELFDTIYLSAGRRGVQLELAPADLVRATDAVVAGITHVGA